MKKIIPLLIAGLLIAAIVLLFSCSKKGATGNDTCYTCKWGPDVNGYVRPDFRLCTDKDWKTLRLFFDERGNWLGGHCDK